MSQRGPDVRDGFGVEETAPVTIRREAERAASAAAAVSPLDRVATRQDLLDLAFALVDCMRTPTGKARETPHATPLVRLTKLWKEEESS